jgi:molybdate transport system substrate-binding protein
MEDPAEDLVSARIALADPAVAPFGLAAREVLASLDLDPETLDLVFPDSVGQVAALFETGNVPFAFVASSQIAQLSQPLFNVPVDALHTPIRQDAVLLVRAEDNPAAQGFFDYLGEIEATRIIAAAGYGVPE